MALVYIVSMQWRNNEKNEDFKMKKKPTNSV